MNSNLLTIIALFYFFSCSDKSYHLPTESENDFINLSIDSFLTIDLKTDHYSFVRFVPKEQNTLWFFNQKDILKKIDLNNPDSLINIKLPEALLGRVFNKRDVVLDNQSPNFLWIANNRKGLFKYDSDSKQFIKTQLTNCNQLHIFDNWIICINANQILAWNKTINQIDTIDKFAGQYIFDVRESQRFDLVINGYRYDTKSHSLEKITKINSIEIPLGFNNLTEKDSFIVNLLGEP